MMTAQEFEAAYGDRAVEWAAERGSGHAVLLGDAVPPDAGRVLAGWWCADDRPDAKLVLPNPWDERAGVAIMERHCWEVTESLVRRLSPLLDRLHGPCGERFWHLVLGPWLLLLVSGIADRHLFIKTAALLEPGGTALGVPGHEVPATMGESVQRLRHPLGNAALMSLLAPAQGLRVRALGDSNADDAARSHSSLRREMAAQALRDPRYAASLLADVGVARASRLVTGRDRGRRVVIVGKSGLHGLDELALLRRVPGLRFPRGTPDLGEMPVADSAIRDALPAPVAGDCELETAVLTVLPAAMPRSVLEGFEIVRAASRRGYGASASVVVGNYSADETQNEFIARCEARGGRLAFAQHGGFYGQSEVHAQERLEIRPGSEFWSWGPRPEPEARQVASPWTARLRDTHEGGDSIMLIEGVHPPDRYVLRFASTPLGNQALHEADRLERLVQSAGRSRVRMVLKRYPTQAEEAARPPALGALPSDGPRGAHGASGWMQRAAIAVVAYPDTPFIEALVIGVPTIGLWDPALYEWRPDARDLVLALGEARIVFADPEAAARHLDAVADDPGAWWRSRETTVARARFLERFAPVGGWLSDWSTQLRRLRDGD